MEIAVNFQNQEELYKLLKNLPGSMTRKVLRKALKEGGKVVKDMASENVKAVTSGESTGVLANGLAVYNLRKYRGNLRVGVQVKRGLVNQKKIIKGQPVRVGLYASVLEYGKANQPPRSWIRKAAREGADPALLKISAETAKGLNDAIRDAKNR